MNESPAARLEQLRAAIRAENISYGEIAELQGLIEHIDPSDVELLEWAGVPEHPEDEATTLLATVEFKLTVPYGTDLGKISPQYVAEVLGSIIDIEDEPVEPFSFSDITVTHIGLETT